MAPNSDYSCFWALHGYTANLNKKNLTTDSTCTANVYSSITDKLMHLFVASTLKCLFWDFLELCDNYRQISVELTNNKNTQRKNWENFEIMKKNS